LFFLKQQVKILFTPTLLLSSLQFDFLKTLIVLLACVLLFKEAKRVLAEASFGVNQAEIERNLRDKFGLNLSSEKISKILSDGIEKDFMKTGMKFSF